MTKKGCSYNGGACHAIVDECNGCARSKELGAGWYCTACPEPKIKWKTGTCNLATHIEKKAAADAHINPLKASKRGG